MGTKNERGPFSAWVEDYTEDKQEIILRVEHEDGQLPHSESISVRECGRLQIGKSVTVFELPGEDGSDHPHIKPAI